MYYCFCGPPSSQAIFVSRLGIELLRHAFGDFQLVYANGARELLGQLNQEQGRRRSMLYFDFPDPLISRVIIEKGIPTVLVSEPFEDVVSYAMAAWEMDILAAIRLATHSVVALYPIGGSSTIKPLRLEDRELTLSELVNLLVLSLGIEVTSDAVERLVASYGDEKSLRLAEIVRHRIEHTDKAFALRSKLASEEQRLLADIASGYQALMDGRRPDKIVWPGAICLSGDRHDQSMSGPVEMTGPARILSFGPYLHLPAGHWSAEMRFFVSGNRSKNFIVMEITAGADILAIGQGELPAAGVFAMSVPFAVKEPAIPVEVRSVLRRGAIEGDFRLLEIVVTPNDGSTRDAL